MMEQMKQTFLGTAPAAEFVVALLDYLARKPAFGWQKNKGHACLGYHPKTTDASILLYWPLLSPIILTLLNLHCGQR